MSVPIQFFSKTMLAGKTSEQRIGLVLDTVRRGSIVVFEEALSREEERLLFTQTMKLVSKKFPGIEVSSIDDESQGLRGKFIKLLGGNTGFTVVGPSNLLKQVKRDSKKLELIAGKGD